jgi:REP element-mobilizing transposase RayT
VRGLDHDSAFKSCMKVVRQRSSRAFKCAFDECLWQEVYFDHVVRDADNEREVIRYIVENPVRAGLCASAGDYRYSWWPGHPMTLTDVRGAEL